MARSPIEIMIDRACGLDPSAPPRPQARPLTIQLRCPFCGSEKAVQRASIDPVRATLVCYPCPSCEPVAAAVDPIYYDGQGKEVPLNPS